MPTKTIVAERQTQQRNNNRKTLESQVNQAIGIAMKSGRGSGWNATVGKIEERQTNTGWAYQVTIKLETTSNRASLLNKFPSIVQRFAQAGSRSNMKAFPWKVISPEGFEHIALEAKEQHTAAQKRKEQSQEPKVLGEISIDPGTHFDRLFGREPHLRRVLAALSLAKRTEYRKRPHMLFCGDPGGGKTEMTRCIQAMTGEEGVAWRRYDAPAMTKAGALEDLMSSDKVPPLLFLEEIEKVETDHALRWLLGLMDERGVIQRTNYRVGNQAKNVRMVVIATCNDVELLKKVMYGALYSRFKGNIINFPYPNIETMEKILARELKDIPESKPEWIKAALDFGYEKLGLRDPREIISIMNVGGDRLLQGEYQEDYMETMHPDDLQEIKSNKERLEKRTVAVEDARKNVS